MAFDATIVPLAVVALSMLTGFLLSWTALGAFRQDAEKAAMGSTMESEAKTRQLIAGLSMCICVVATIAYSSMIRRRVRVPSGDDRRMIRITRYIDWLITLPLLAAELRLYLVLPLRFDMATHSPPLFLAMIFAFATVFCGYHLPSNDSYAPAPPDDSASSLISRKYQLWLCAGCIFMLLCYACMFLWPVESELKFQDGANDVAAFCFAALWIPYPVVQYLIDRGNTFDVDKNWDELCFGILDVAAKVGPAFYAAFKI